MVDTLVATDVAARGIDVAGITHVINYDIPATRDDYVHRVGRTARAGASGVGVTLVAHDQARELAGMVGGLGLHSELHRGGLPSDATSGQGPRSHARARTAGGPRATARGTAAEAVRGTLRGTVRRASPHAARNGRSGNRRSR